MMYLFGGGFWPAFAQVSAFYYTAGCILHFVVPRLISVKRIQKQARGTYDVTRDCLYSLGPLAVKALVWTLCEHLHKKRLGLLYIMDQPFTAWHVGYMMLCILVLDYAHDTWFYWTHRLLHQKALYQHIHYIHHKSSAPTPFTGYSFHVVEAALVFANEILICFFLPMHLGLHRMYHLFTTIIHQGGHAGYEMAPFIPTAANLLSVAFNGVRKGRKDFNTVQHHDMHHRYPTKHFSLYFVHWDRLCGTLHPRYEGSIFTYFPGDARRGVTTKG